jgi:hypothetical protein
MTDYVTVEGTTAYAVEGVRPLKHVVSPILELFRSEALRA